jgi:phosphoglycolate phosphatase-like HAD superfamily hydrolase
VITDSAAAVTHLVMFDIDGTLVDSAGFDGALYAQAVRDVLAAHVDETWASYRNVTDSGILEELLVPGRLDAPYDDIRARVQTRFIKLVRDYLATHSLREVAGAMALIQALRAAPHVRVAIATGGWKETALLKLHAIGLDPAGVSFASASDAFERTKIMQLAERRATSGAPPGRRTYFGDGAWDKRACAELGYDFIAIGKGVEHEPRFDDFSDRAGVLAALGL